MRKILSFLIGLVSLMVSQGAMAEVVTTYCTDASGVFYLRCEYNSDENDLQVYLYDYDPAFITTDVVFPETLHGEFVDYDGNGNDKEDDFEYQLDCSLDFIDPDVRNTVESITILTHGAIPDYFAGYSMLESHTEPTNLKRITIGEFVTEIGEEAFAYHENLETIESQNNRIRVHKIGNRAFLAAVEEGMIYGEYTYYSHLTDIGRVLFSTDEIGEEAFCGHSNLTKLDLSGNGTYEKIGRDAFRYCGITELTLTSNAGSAGMTSSPFLSCPLEKVVINNCYDNVSETNIAIINPYMFANVGSKFDLTFQTVYPSKPYEVVVIGEHSFSNSGVKSVTMPENYMLSPVYPYAVYFGESSFEFTYYLESLDLSKVSANYITIDNKAFYYSHIKSLELPESLLQAIGDEAFAGSYLTGDITISQLINIFTKSAEPMEIGENAFASTSNLKSVTFDGSISYSGTPEMLAPRMFYRSAIEEVTLPSSLTEIGGGAFEESNLKSFTGTEAITEIGAEAFKNCKKLERVDLSKTNLMTFQVGLFQYANALTELLQPEGLQIYHQYCFEGTALKTLDITTLKVDKNAIYNMPELEEVHYTNGKQTMVTEGSLVSLPKLKTVDFGEKIERLNAHFISDCPQYDSVVITPAISEIDKEAFADVSDQISAITLQSSDMKDLTKSADAPFAGVMAALYFDPSVTTVASFVFAEMEVTNSVELHSGMTFHEDAFKNSVIDQLDWHYADITSNPFKGASIINNLTFSKITDLKADNLFAKAEIENLYLEGLTSISGKGVFAEATIDNNQRNYTLFIPATMTNIGEEAFMDISTDNLLFEKGEGLTIGAKAFKRSSGAYQQITTYYDKDNIPAADATSFEFTDDIDKFFAGGCEDVAAYRAATGWKEIGANNWDGITEYKYSFKIVGEATERPIEYYYDYIYVNGASPRTSYIGCTNSASIAFFSPCSGIVFDHWEDKTTDNSDYTITLTSDTVIRIYVKESQQDLKLALSDPNLSDVATIYMSVSGEEQWVEQSEAKVNDCEYTSYDAKVEISDPEHYNFVRWINAKDNTTYSDGYGISYLTTAADLRAEIQPVTYYLMVDTDPSCMDCYEMLDKFVFRTEDDMDENSTFYKSVPYNTEVEVEFVGQKSGSHRYILDYWTDNYGNIVSEENPYRFTMTEDLQLYPVIKEAGTYAITAASSDDALGKVAMTHASDAETSKGSGLYWEGSKIDLTADATAEHTSFKQWNDGSKEQYRQITVRKSYDYVAEFEKDSFNITVSVEGINAELVTVSGTGRYGWNDEVTLSYTLSDNEHYTFDAWYGDKIYGDEATFTFAAQKNAEIRLRFVANTYTITAVAEPAEGGTITGSGDAFYKDKVILTAEANEGYTFVGWKDDDTAPAKREVEVLGNATYTAVFEAIDYTPKDLTVEREKEGNDERITLSWGAVKGATSYEIMLLNGSQVITTANTMGYTVVSQLVSVLKEDYNLAGGTYTINWAVRSTDENGIDISDWAYGESFVITIADAPTALDETESDVRARKVVKDGVIYIIKGDKVYNALGKEIR